MNSLHSHTGQKLFSLPLSRDNFKDDIVYYPGSKLHSEQIKTV